MGLGLHYQPGQTPLDEEESEGLKIKTITTQGELNEFEQNNIEHALLWLKKQRIAPSQILTENFILKLHQKMYGEVWKWAGLQALKLADKNNFSALIAFARS